MVTQREIEKRVLGGSQPDPVRREVFHLIGQLEWGLQKVFKTGYSCQHLKDWLR